MELQLSNSPSNKYSGLTSFKIDWLDLLAVWELVRIFSNTVQKHQFFGAQLSSQSSSHIHTWLQWLTIFLGSKITADGDCSHEVKRCLLLGRKIMINLGSIFKSRDITLPTKVHLVKVMVFPVIMYGCELDCEKLSTEELMLLNCGAGEDS